jgi:hypothetical protein
MFQHDTGHTALGVALPVEVREICYYLLQRSVVGNLEVSLYKRLVVGLLIAALAIHTSLGSPTTVLVTMQTGPTSS